MTTEDGRSGFRLVRRRLLASVQRSLDGLTRQALARLGERRSKRLQELSEGAAAALRRVAARWPQLARLVGLGATPVSSTSVAEAPSGATRPDPAPTGGALASRAASLDTLRSSIDLAERVHAVDALARFVDDEATAALLAALRDASSEVAVHAAQALGGHRGTRVISALREVIANPDRYFHAETRASAVRTLGTILPAGEGAPLAVAVADPEASVSLAAIAALAERDEPLGTDALLGVIERADGFYLPITRHAAARALGRMHRYDVPRVRALVDREADPEVRSALASLALAP